MHVLEKIAGVICTLLLSSGLLVSRAQAGHIVTFQEVGNDVVATGSGPLDLSGLTPLMNNSAVAIVGPQDGVVATGPAIPNLASVTFLLMSFDAGIQFGVGAQVEADNGTGDLVGLLELIGNDVVIVPEGYISGNPLSNTSTYLNRSFASLGLTPGVYVWTWGGGQNQNFTLRIGREATPSPVPEPESWLLLGTALAGLIAFRSRRGEQRTPQD